MLDEYNTPESLWAEAINRLFLQKFLGKTPYELLNGKKPIILPGVWLQMLHLQEAATLREVSKML